MADRPKTFSERLAEDREALKRDDLPPDVRTEYEENCRIAEEMTKEELESLDYFLCHMPDPDADLVLVVLKGHLLIEQRLREFVDLRMVSPKALAPAQLESHQVICLAEALTLPGDEQKALWDCIRKLNTLRNEIAHNLVPKGLEQRVSNIVDTFGKRWEIDSGLPAVMAHCYAYLTLICQHARSPDYRMPRE